MNYEPSPILGAIAIVLVIVGAICALWAGLHAIGKWADRLAATQGVRYRHELLGDSLLKACKGDLTRAYAAVEHEHLRDKSLRDKSLFAQKMLALKAAGVPERYKKEYEGDWAPQSQVDRGGGDFTVEQLRRARLDSSMREFIGIRIVDTSSGLRKQLVMEPPDPIYCPAGADWRER